MFSCHFWGWKHLFLFRGGGQQNVCLKNSVTEKVTGTEAIWFPSSKICPAHQAEQLRKRVYIKRNRAWCVRILFFAHQSSAQVWKCATSRDYFHHDLGSLENIRLRKNSPHGQKSFLEYSCLKLLLHPKFWNSYFCSLRD